MSLFSLFSQSLIKENYIFFDVETTGLFPLLGNKIIEIAMIKTSKGNVIDTIETFINPQMPIPEEATFINKITNEMIINSPIFDNNFAEKILNFIGDNILVAHNAPFDLSFLSVELGRIGITFDRWEAIDTLKIANEIFPGQKNRLENLIKRYNLLPEGNLHRALVDTDALRKIFFEFLDESEIRSYSIDQLIKKYGFSGKNIYRAIPGIIREALIEKKRIQGVYKTREKKIINLSIIPKAPIWVEKKWVLLAKEEKTNQELYLYCDNFLEIITK